ncbi:hypothetical protein [uncultured Pelagimonas sp.]|uniref:hypothetical protein n=1 Tax=uncultured Pelagimonas sp. TaxID=1618102 RepID=UPI002608F95D|nr:hypothetical protein [uncultured Pelagimonas sp.]
MGEAKRRMNGDKNQFDRLNKELTDLGVKTDQFGFCDEREFLAAERSNPTILETYAKWVMLRPRDANYDAHVNRIVPKLAQLVAAVLEEDELEGSCEMACSLLTKSLDRLGVWSVGIVGSSTFEVKGKNIWRGLHTVDRPDFPGARLGHTWVCAPPFIVVDASIKRQRWSGDAIYPYVPSIILDNHGQKTKPTPKDVISSEIRGEMMMVHGTIPDGVIYQREPNLKKFSETFPATEVMVDELTARYIPTAASLADGTLEEINGGGDKGRIGREIWNDVIMPAFNVKQ